MKPARWEIRWLIGIGLLALFARIFFLYVGTAKANLGPGDDDGDHINFSRSLAADGNYVSFVPGSPYPRQAWRPPLFILFLAGVFKLHGIDAFMAARWYLAVLSLLIPLGCWYLTRKLWSAPAAFLAYTWACFHPSFIYYSANVQNDSFFLIFSTWAVVALLLQSNVPQAAGAGLLTGLACLGRSQFLGISLMGSLWMLVRPRNPQRLIRAAVFFGMVIALLIPWWVRNYRVFHRFLPTSTEGGYTLWVGNNPLADGGGNCPPSYPPEGLDEIGRDRWHYREAFTYIKTHPRRTVELAGSKLKRYWALVPRVGGTKIKAVSFATYFPMFVLALIGLWVWRARFWEFAPIVGMACYYTAIQSLFPSLMRYRLSLEPFLISLASATAVHFFSKGDL